MPVMMGFCIGATIGPDRLSVQVNVTTTDWFVHTLGVYVELTVIVGGVWSMLMPLTMMEVWFPALSVSVPGTLCAAPSADSWTGALHVAIPDCWPGKP